MKKRTFALLVDTVTYYDARAFEWTMRRKRAALIARVARQISRLGDGPLYAAMGALLALVDGSRGWAFLYAGLFSFALELPLYLAMKNTIRRDRPFVQTGIPAFIKPSDKFSFPSGHTAAAFLMATLLAHFHPAVAPFAFGMAMLIGASRVLLGVHYCTDIAAGALLGILAAGFGLLAQSAM